MNSMGEHLPGCSFGKELFFQIVLTLSLFFSIVFIPFAGFLVGILTPLPTVLAFIRCGTPIGWLVPAGAGLAGALIMLWLGLAPSIPYLFGLLAMGLVMGYGVRRQWRTDKAIGMSGLVLIGMAAVMLAAAYFQTHGELVALLEQDLQSSVSSALKEFGTQSADSQALEKSLTAAVPLMVRLMPGITIASSMLIAWLNMLIARRYCRRMALQSCLFEDWTLWKAPEPLVWVVIAGGLMLLVQWEGLTVTALNLLVVTGCIYLLQGLSIAAFYMNRWHVPFLMRAFIYCVLLLQQFASLGTAVLGLFDMWFDFRRMVKKPV